MWLEELCLWLDELFLCRSIAREGDIDDEGAVPAVGETVSMAGEAVFEA
jgi:hypothetical protein